MGFFVERDRGRLRAGWRLLAQVVVFQAATFFLLAPLTAIWFVTGSSESPSEGLAATLTESTATLFLGSIASLGGIFFSLWLAGRFIDRRSLKDYGFHLDRGWWFDLVFGLVLGIFLMSGIFLIELSFGWLRVDGTFEPILSGTPFWAALALPLVIFLCVGIYEEAFSRGYQLLNMAEGLNYSSIGPRGAVLAAWVLSSSIFGVLHLGNPNATPLSALNIALAGLLLGAGYVLSGELAVPIGLHFAWNFFQGNVYGFPVSGLNPIGATFISTKQTGPDIWTGGLFGPEGGLLATFATLTGIALTAFWTRFRRGRVGIHTPLAEYPGQASMPKEE